MVPAINNPTVSRRVVLTCSEPGPARWISDLDSLLGRRGLELCRLRSGRQAVRLLGESSAEALILCEQDDGEGLSCWRMIRHLRANLPCVFVARRASPRLLCDALSLCVTSVLTQPVESEILTGVMTRIVERRLGREIAPATRLAPPGM